MPWPKDIVLIGAGNVAWHLGRQLKRCGQNVCHIYSRHVDKALSLAQELGCSASLDSAQIPLQADLYLLLVPDNAILEVAEVLQKQGISDQSLVMHSSGATPADVLAPYFAHYGVFYPLQTFSRERVIDFADVPLCLLTGQSGDYEKVEQLAQQLVHKSYSVSDEQRAHLHLAAIFANNFTNYLQHISQEIALEHNLPTDLLHPLLQETVAKLAQLTPQQAQTGPAIRKDKITIDRHLEMLNNHPQWAELYRKLSAGIERDLG